MHPATVYWYDRRDSVFIEFCVADSKDVEVTFEKSKCVFSCLGAGVKYENEIDLFDAIEENECNHKRTGRSVLCILRKAQPGKPWLRLTKDKTKLSWLRVDFNNWKDWEDDSDEEMGNSSNFSDLMNNMGGDEDLDLEGPDEDESADSDDESKAQLTEMPDLE
uniref:prostaglandin E synthase 3b isoform X1 n=1 Tax=Solea senegalensis TaxID=28829 RepID=UPI001CD88B38|nr:prostaglandin E synthase 3b isoform X1 [Solea senegalensis]